MPRWILLVFVLAACNGPDAPDVALCRDYVHRLCIPEVCPAVVPLFTPGTDCEMSLLNKSGCSSDNFTFTNPDRATFLNCRLVVLPAGDNVEQHPNCDDVSQSFIACPLVERMFSFDGGNP